MKFFPARLARYFSNDLGIDLGTANTIVYVKNRGIVLDQPSVVAIKKITNEVLAAGDKAKEMLGKTPESIIACRPMRDGVIANYQLTESMLRFFIKEVHNNRTALVRPRMIIGVPSGITQVEKRAIEDSAKQAGAREVFTIMEPMAAAIGAGLAVEDPTGNMIVDIGGGTTEVAIISLKDVVYCKSVRMGGDEMDRAIVQYIKRKYNLLVGERTAEIVKITIGTAMLGSDIKEAVVKGRDLMTGLPKSITMTDAEVFEALTEPIAVIIDAVRSALENTPPELSSDLADRGITLAGGTSQLKNLTTLIQAETKLPVRLAEDPLRCVVTGIGKVLDNLDFFRDALMK
jgi:rod shape-determining protein MreB